jgi:hypothetical protein
MRDSCSLGTALNGRIARGCRFPLWKRGIKGDLFLRCGRLHCTRVAVLWDDATKCKQENLPCPSFPKRATEVLICLR